MFKGSVAVLEARAVFLMVFQVYESCSSYLRALALQVSQVQTGSGALSGLSDLLAAPGETVWVDIAKMKDHSP